MGSLIIVLTAFAVYYSEVYCDTLPTKVATPENTVLLERNNSGHATIEKGSFWKSLSLPKRKPTKVEGPRNLDSANSEANKRKGRFFNSLAFLTGLSFGGLATAASSTMKTIGKMPQVFSLNLGSSKTSPYFAAYYSQYPYAPLLPYPFFYPGSFGLAPTIDAAKPQTSQNDLMIDLAGDNEDYTDTEKFNAGNGADDRIRLRAKVDRNAEEKDTIRGCKEGQRKHSNVKGTTRERQYLHANSADLRATLNYLSPNQTAGENATTISPPDNANTTHHHHYYYHPPVDSHFPGYYGGYPQSIHHVELTTQPYSQFGYNVPYEQSGNLYRDDNYNVYPRLTPPISAPFSPSQINEYAGTDFNRFYPSGYQPPNISDGFKPLK